MADRATLITRITEAEAAVHKLATGAQTAEVMMDGQKVVYTQAKLPDLRAYLADLRAQLARAGGTCAEGATPRRVSRVFIGC